MGCVKSKIKHEDKVFGFAMATTTGIAAEHMLTGSHIVENQQHAPEVLFSGGTGGEEFMPGYFGCGDIGGAAGAGGDGGGGGCGGCGGCGC